MTPFQLNDREVSSAFPFFSRYLIVNQAKIHYVDEGDGSVCLFLHDVPLSSYLFRNVIAELRGEWRCIAPDFIGMGKSDKPDIHYSLQAHADYIGTFIDKLKLSEITLVMHGWGSVVGLYLAQQYPEKFSRLAFMEPYLPPILDRSQQAQQLLLAELGGNLCSTEQAYRRVVEDNELIEKILPQCLMRELDAVEMETYRQPYLSRESRRVLWHFVQDNPILSSNEEVAKIIEAYSAWLQHCSLPKLLLYALPGLVASMQTVVWCQEYLPNMTLSDIGESIHYGQEDTPQTYTLALKDWLAKTDMVGVEYHAI